jgi:hypothetical protein
MDSDFAARIIGGLIAIGIVAIGTKLFRAWKRDVLRKERHNYTYAQIADNFEFWDGYINNFLPEDQRLSKKEFERLSIDEKIEIATKNLGPSRKHNRKASSLTGK